MEAVLMPKSGISVESCIIGAWKKAVGDAVVIGDVLFDYETDKAAFECESTAAGVLLDIFYESGDEVEVLKPVCAIGEAGEDASLLRGDAAPAAPDPIPADPADPAGSEAAPASSPGAAFVSPQGDAKASPRARIEAAKLGVNWADAQPTGPNGRIVADDVDALYERVRTGEDVSAAHAPQDGSSPADAAPPAAVSAGHIGTQDDAAGYVDEKLPKVRRVIASSMMDSLHGTAQLTHHHSFDATEILGLRARFKKEPEGADVSGISIGDMVIYAAVRVLAETPDINAHFMEGDVVRKFSRVHMGVAIDTPRGLLVPTIFDADQKTLVQISREVKYLAGLARSGSISPDLLRGGTFTVSNLGATGVEMFTPILNPPQVGILGVCGSVTKFRTAADGSIQTYPAIGLSLTYDHRAIDGAPASRFAQAVVKKLENFSVLLAG
jgi:pyruvate dehydrogenase E2 component (dihydrolipoamide acetyltransferase)